MQIPFKIVPAPKICRWRHYWNGSIVHKKTIVTSLDSTTRRRELPKWLPPTTRRQDTLTHVFTIKKVIKKERSRSKYVQKYENIVILKMFLPISFSKTKLVRLIVLNDFTKFLKLNLVNSDTLMHALSPCNCSIDSPCECTIKSIFNFN